MFKENDKSTIKFQNQTSGAFQMLIKLLFTRRTTIHLSDSYFFKYTIIKDKTFP